MQICFVLKRDWRTPWAAWILIVGWVLPAGCAGSLKTHYADVGQIVRSSTGQDIEWPVRPSTEAEMWNVITPMLGRPLTAAEAVRLALINNRALQATLREIGIARADLIQAGLPANPRLAMRYRWQTEGDASDTRTALSQEIMGLIVMPLRRHVAKQQLEQAKARVADAALDLACQARIAFYTLQGHMQARERQREFVEAMTSAAERGRRMRLAGDLSEQALLARELALSQARQDLAGIDLQITTDREQMNRLMGLTGMQAATWSIAGELPQTLERDPSPGDLEALALKRRMDLAALRGEGAAIRETIKLQRITRWIPFLQIGVNYERKTNKTEVVGPTLALELPIFDWGQARHARTNALLEQSQQRTAALENEICSEVRETQARLTAAREAVQSFRETILPQFQRLTALDRAGSGEGSAGGNDWLKAQQDEAKAWQEYIQALRDYWISCARLGQVTGGFREANH